MDKEKTYLSVSEASKKWHYSERGIRELCKNKKIRGARKTKTGWRIPSESLIKKKNNSALPPSLLDILRREDDFHIRGGIYHKVQIDLTYNSNHIEGSTLTHEQTRYIFETNTVLESGPLKGINVDDIVETANHFRCVGYIIENANRHLTTNMLKSLHFILKNGTADSRKNWFMVGDFKKLPNEVGGLPTCPPEEVAEELRKLLNWYEKEKNHSLETLLEFHYRFEKIHPFQDGNGRIGRLILFKECLRFDIVPFIITDDLKAFYHHGLKEWTREKGYLRNTCLTSQDNFKKILDYFQIDY